MGEGSPSTSGVQVRSPGRCLGDWSSFETFFTDLDCRSDQSLKISDNSPLDAYAWPLCFTVGLSDIFGGLSRGPSPLAHAWCRDWSYKHRQQRMSSPQGHWNGRLHRPFMTGLQCLIVKTGGVPITTWATVGHHTQTANQLLSQKLKEWEL